MPSIRNVQKCQWLFILYLVVIAIFPYSHSHSDDELSLASSDGPAYSSTHNVDYVLDVRHGDHYADTHTSHDDRHVHFLAEDSNSAPSPPAIEKAALLGNVTVSDIAIVQFSKQSAMAMFADLSRSYADVFRLPYSGLSPPAC